MLFDAPEGHSHRGNCSPGAPPLTVTSRELHVSVPVEPGSIRKSTRTQWRPWKDIPDGAKILVGGFGTVWNSGESYRRPGAEGVKNLTVVSNNCEWTILDWIDAESEADQADDLILRRGE